MKKFVPQMEPWFGEEEANAVTAYMKNDGWITEFKKTQEFEREIAKYTNSKHCVVVNNGTISLTLAALSLGLKHGDEVIVPNYTMVATPNSVQMFGAKPVFVDVEKETLCLDIDKVKKAVNSNTKAIILVSSNGRYPKSGVEEFEKLCKLNDIFLIEDSAQSLGSYYPDGRHIGTAGIVGSFSFSAPKVISTGQGGALVTNDDIIAHKLRRLKDFGRSGGGNDIHDSIGYNFKFTDVQACIGIEQMKKLDWRVERKKEIYKLYRKFMMNNENVTFFEQDLDKTSPWFIDVAVNRRGELQEFLKNNNVGSRIMYPPLNAQKAYSVNGSFPVSEYIGEKGLWLPSASQLKNDEIKSICDLINSFYK
jgi:perosamine synthetase